VEFDTNFYSKFQDIPYIDSFTCILFIANCFHSSLEYSSVGRDIACKIQGSEFESWYSNYFTLKSKILATRLFDQKNNNFIQYETFDSHLIQNNLHLKCESIDYQVCFPSNGSSTLVSKIFDTRISWIWILYYCWIMRGLEDYHNALWATIQVELNIIFNVKP
jgi:hypothetical protein